MKHVKIIIIFCFPWFINTTGLATKHLPKAIPSHREILKNQQFKLGQTIQTTKTRSLPDVTLVEENPNELTQATNYSNYLKACYLHAQGKGKQSFDAYQQLISRNPTAYVYDGFFRLLFDVGQFKAITTTFEKQQEKFTTAFKDNLDIKLILAQSYLQSDQDEKAETLFAELADAYPDNDQIAYFKALGFMKNESFDKAQAYLNECLENQTFRSKHFLFHFLKSKIYLHNNHHKEALAEIEKSLELFPKFDRGWLFKAMLLEQQGAINDAISGYQRFLTIVGREESVEKQLIQLLFLQKRYPDAAKVLRKIKSSAPEYYFDLALLELKSGNFKDAQGAIEACLAKAPTYAKARLLKIEILGAQQKGQEALSILEGWLTQEPYNNFILHTMLLLRKTNISTQAIIDVLEKIKEKASESLGILATLGDLYLEINKPSEGITHYQKIAQTTQDKALQAKVAYQVGHVLFVTQQYEKFENFLATTLHHQPTTPALCNLVAFYYATTNKELETALSFIDKALQEETESPYFLDTKGFILFKMGKPKEAQTIFEKAVKHAPEDATIKEHLALVYKK